MREANPQDLIGQLEHNMWVHQCHGRGAANREFALLNSKSNRPSHAPAASSI
jgi:hypothetical protein